MYNGTSPLVSGAQGETGDFWLTASPSGSVLPSAPGREAGSMCEWEISKENPGAAGNTKAEGREYKSIAPSAEWARSQRRAEVLFRTRLRCKGRNA